MVCMEVTVIIPAPPTVKKVRVTFKMEVAIHVVMDGQECIVKMVWCFKYVIFYLIINVNSSKYCLLNPDQMASFFL